MYEKISKFDFLKNYSKLADFYIILCRQHFSSQKYKNWLHRAERWRSPLKKCSYQEHNMYKIFQILFVKSESMFSILILVQNCIITSWIYLVKTRSSMKRIRLICTLCTLWYVMMTFFFFVLSFIISWFISVLIFVLQVQYRFVLSGQILKNDPCLATLF